MCTWNVLRLLNILRIQYSKLFVSIETNLVLGKGGAPNTNKWIDMQNTPLLRIG